jgi:hypothetical protein
MQQSVLGLSYVSSYRLTQIENATRVGHYLSRPPKNSSEEVHQWLQSAMENSFTRLKSDIEQDISSGKITAS